MANEMHRGLMDYVADPHVHVVFSLCAAVEMVPPLIDADEVEQAAHLELDGSLK